MKLTVNLKINNLSSIEATFEEPNLPDAVQQASALLAFDGKCGCCGSEGIILQGKSAQEFQFTEFVCTGCLAKAQFGQYKKGGYFLKKWEKFQPKETQDSDQPF